MFYINQEIDSKERFDQGKFSEYLDDLHDDLLSYFRNELSNLPQHGLYKISGEEGRPDLLSHNIYGNTQFWWVILDYNGISDPFSLKTGQLIKYPSIASLENLYFELKLRDSSKT